MTGEQFYRSHLGAAVDFGIEDLLAWDELNPNEQAEWETLAYLQELRDRDIPNVIEHG